MPAVDAAQAIPAFYDLIHDAFGPQHWWPGETRDEVIIGSVLTQNTAWTNVERAIDRLKEAGAIAIPSIQATEEATLAQLIKPAGTYRVKARRLKGLAAWIHERYGGDLNVMFAEDGEALREGLLSVHGIGRETADAILLYAGGVPTFVVDAYTKRVLRRHFLIKASADYEGVKSLMEQHISRDAALYGEYHALLVALGKRYCRAKARCDDCPLQAWNHDAEL